MMASSSSSLVLVGVLVVVASLVQCAIGAAHSVPANERTCFSCALLLPPPAATNTLTKTLFVHSLSLSLSLGLPGSALVDLYSATNGPAWSKNSNWLNGDPCVNRWFGVSSNSNNIAVTSLYGPAHVSLSGVLNISHTHTHMIMIDQTYMRVTTIRHVPYTCRDLHNNRLSGTIPTSLSQMQSLRNLYV
jgi:hypothetical protein